MIQDDTPDLATPQALSVLFNLARAINRARDGGHEVADAQARLDEVYAAYAAATGRHVVLGDDTAADILGGDILALQAFDGAAEGAEQVRRLVLARIAPDHGLAAAERNVSHGILVAHTLAETQGVPQHGFTAGIVPHPATAGSRSAGRRMDRYDRS